VQIRHVIGLGFGLVIVFCLSTIIAIALARGNAKCPNCLSSRVRSSTPTPVDRLLYLIYLRPYRCQACRKRFYAMKRRRAHEQSRGAAAGSGQ
jgi:hypothetical protein